MLEQWRPDLKQRSKLCSVRKPLVMSISRWKVIFCLLHCTSQATLANVFACKSEIASRAFAAADISAARLALWQLKAEGKEQEKCARELWLEGMNSASSNLQNIGAATPSASKVLVREGDHTCEEVNADSISTLPRLLEIAVCIRLNDRLLELEQDGALRPYDMATVLWPAGFRLAQWVVDHCDRVRGNVLELAAGLGAPSIVASFCDKTTVLATDKEPYALPNILLNSRINAAALQVQLLDWTKEADILKAEQSGGYDVVLAAGVGPHKWAQDDWQRVARLLRPGQGKLLLCLSAYDLDLSSGTVGSVFAVTEEDKEEASKYADWIVATLRPMSANAEL